MSRRKSIFEQLRRGERASELRHEAIIGIVVDIQDPEKLGRIKVKFPTLGEDSSHWATISALGAGNNRGWWFLPEIDDEVLVMFAHGELSRPVVLGALWNGVDAPPDQNGGGNERRMIVSRSGHKVTFDDDGGTITFEDGGGIGVITIEGEKIDITASQGDVQCQAPMGETNIEAKDVKITSSGGDVTLSAKGDLTLDGTKVVVQGGSGVEVSGSTTNVNQ